jgi:hypothetical protein
VLLFFLLIGLVFWISSLHDRPDFGRKTRLREDEEKGMTGVRGAHSART